MAGETDRHNIELKILHSKKVSAECVNIGRSLGMDQMQLNLCAILGLIHDAGRFHQYYTYKTFSDAKSENHALLGARVLKNNGVLDCLPPREKDIILHAVLCHNHKNVSASGSEEKDMFLRVLRDADKLDIYRVVTEYYENNDKGANAGIELDLPVSDDISPAVADDITGLRLVDIAKLKTSTDFKILQLGWIFDIQFPYTFGEIKKRRFIPRLCAALPQSEETKDICSIIHNYLQNKTFEPDVQKPMEDAL